MKVGAVGPTHKRSIFHTKDPKSLAKNVEWLWPNTLPYVIGHQDAAAQSKKAVAHQK